MDDMFEPEGISIPNGSIKSTAARMLLTFIFYFNSKWFN